MNKTVPVETRKGRGAGTNESGRFERAQREAFDDGWNTIEELPERLDTTYTRDHAKTILARNDSPDIPFDRSINPYRGCEHGCIYCFARPSHAYLGLSPGLDFESRIFVKEDAAELLRAELARPSYQCRTIALGANTDPYQPAEKKFQITRRVLEVLRELHHPVSIVTKSALVTRDIDILSEMAARRLASVAISLTTLDRKLARAMEPRAATPQRRLDTMRALSDAGVPVCVLASPMIPALNDSELDAILEAAASHGAQAAGTILLRLPLELGPLVEDWLNRHFPDKAKHVLSLVRQARGGKIYTSEWGQRMTGTGPYADLLQLRFDKACKRLGLNQRRAAYALDTTQFRKPAKQGEQLSLL
ncbi:MAG TPA: PA0069 family radical SAM protein [Stellaceae bacterium]|jgi:DNA repair photolyase|nr:PA0069 family radical SAM protein [Stellaceae bacterium]